VKLHVPPLGPLSGILYYWLSLICPGPVRLSVLDFLAILNHSAEEVHSFCKLPIGRNNLIGELQFFSHLFPNTGFGVVLVSKSRGIRVEVFNLASETTFLNEPWKPISWQFPALKPMFVYPVSPHKYRIAMPLSSVTSLS
jgi:hypothetical protein